MTDGYHAIVDRRRPQRPRRRPPTSRRPGARTVVLEARHKVGGAADTMAPWPEAPEFKVTTLSYVMSLMPDTIQRDLKLADHGYRSTPGRPVLPAVPRRALHRPVRRRREEELRIVRAVLQARRRRDRALGRLDRRPRRGARPDVDVDPAHRGVDEARAISTSSCGSRGASAGSTSRTRRRHPPDDDEHRRHPRPVLRDRPGEDRDGAQRPDRHVGRPVRAGHRLRDGAPFDRRRRRRPPRRVGGARRRHGRRERRDRLERAQLRRRDPHRRPRREGAHRGWSPRPAWCSRAARSSARRSSSPRSIRRSRSSSRSTGSSCRPSSSTTSTTGRRAAAS